MGSDANDIEVRLRTALPKTNIDPSITASSDVQTPPAPKYCSNSPTAKHLDLDLYSLLQALPVYIHSQCSIGGGPCGAIWQTLGYLLRSRGWTKQLQAGQHLLQKKIRLYLAGIC